MEVNENIYGSSSQWVSCYYQQEGLTNKNKKAWFGGESAQTQLRTAVLQNKLSYNEPIDKSLAYCGFGTESALSHRAFIGKDPENTGYLKIYEYQDSSVSNWAFFEKTMQYGATNNPVVMGYIRLDDLGCTAWNNSINDEWNYSNFLEPYVFLNPHNMVMLINVIAGASLENSQAMELSTYIANRASYPYLYAVYGNLYFGTYPERNLFAGKGTPPTGWKTTTLQCLDNYVCNEKNIDLPMYGISYGGSCILMGNPSRDRTMFNGDDYLNIFYTTEEGKEHIKLQRIDNGLSYAYLEYYDGLIDDILKTAACFGLYFTTKESVAISGALTDTDMYIGLLDSNGVGHGDYLRGAQTENAPQAASDFIDMHTIKYDPIAGDKTKYKNDTEFYDSTLANGFTRFWVLDSSGVNAVLNQMYSIMNEADPDEPIERYSQKVFLTNNPIDCIISLKKFPLDNVPNLSGAYFINFGSKATNILAHPLAKACGVYSFTFSSASDTSLYPHFDKSFLDYEPYTKCELIIPFCGSVDIPCCYLYDYGGIEVKLVIDFISGACTAYILANGITISSVSGNCAIDLPVSGIQSATLDSQIFSAAQAKKQNFTKTRAGLVASALTATAGAFTGNPLLIAAGAAGVLTTAMTGNETRKSLDYELQHLQTPYKEVSSASGQIAQTYDMRCKMIVTRPKLLTGFTESDYAETVGYSCLYTGEVENFHGLTVGSIELAGVPCTAEEKAYIESMFASGVHLPATF